MRLTIHLRRLGQALNCPWTAGKGISGRQWLGRTFGGIGVLLAASALAVYLIDPCLRYRKPSFFKPFFAASQMQIPGILRHYDYEMVVIGNSMTQNYRISDLERAFGLPCVKATSPSLAGVDIATFLDIAISARGDKLKRVATSLDFFCYTSNKKSVITDDAAMFYRDSYLRDHKYWWNYAIWDEYVFRAIKAKIRGKDKLDDADMMFFLKGDAWGVDAIREVNRVTAAMGFSKIDSQMFVNIEEQLVSRISRNPAIRFDIIYSPYCIAYWGALRRIGYLDDYLSAKQIVTEKLLVHPNVTIHDFQAEERVVSNFDLYKDVTHFKPEINHWMTVEMAAGAYVVTAENHVGNITKLRGMIEQAMPLLHEQKLLPEP